MCHNAKYWLYNCDTDVRISSGNIITLFTDDPNECPLPNIELLRLQWLLHRVTAFSAATECEENENEHTVNPLTAMYEEGLSQSDNPEWFMDHRCGRIGNWHDGVW